MKGRATVVLDVGKTMSKLSLWAPDGQLLKRRRYKNERVVMDSYTGLDAAGIEAWLADTLRTFARIADIGAIVPTGHGAAAAAIDDDALVMPPLDYEHPVPAELRREYDAKREPFVMTGSPALPDGLNLGAQLYYLETLRRGLLAKNAVLVPWAQYWSWLLSGVAASEVTSLGCHTDLWRPLTRAHSTLAVERGWADHMAPITPAGTILGSLTWQWAARTGLPRDVEVFCGLHDSNAALLAARAFPQIAGRDATVLSTGTWFIAMRTLGPNSGFDIAELAETRDCLVNVDASGNPVPSARFMGGREIERLIADDTHPIDIPADQPVLLRAVTDVVESGAMALPTFAPGVGPYAHGNGRWISRPDHEAQRRAAICLYAALVTDVSLDLIGARDHLLIEGRFAECEAFVRAVAALRPGTAVYVSRADSDVSSGALRLLNPGLPVPTSTIRVPPLAVDLSDYRQRWRDAAAQMEDATA